MFGGTTLYSKDKVVALIGDEIDDNEWLTELICRTEQELPRLKPRKKKRG